MSVDAKPVDAESSTTEPGPEAGFRPPWRKIVFLAGVVAVLLGVVYLSPLKGYLGRLREISESIRALGMSGPLVVTLGVAALVAIGFPRLLFCVISGMAFGFWWGLLWAQLGTLIGNYALFLTARFGGRGWAERSLAKRGRLRDLIQREGALGVILARQLPVPGLLVNLACGLLSVRHRHFLLGTVIGQLPEAIPCTLIGAGALAPSYGKSAATISIAVVVAVGAWVGLRWCLRRLNKS